MDRILKAFQFDSGYCNISIIGNGLIHSTWLVSNSYDANAIIIQKLNKCVFSNPEGVCLNIKQISIYLDNCDVQYCHLKLLELKNGDVVCKLINQEGDLEYYRAYEYISNSLVFQTVGNPSIAFEAAKQFAKFTKMLIHFDTSKLIIPIPKFHALQDSNSISKLRIEESLVYIQYLQSLSNELVGIYNHILLQPYEFKLRIMHHDTKISNVLFTLDHKGLCVLDLDTCMPGYIISDLGDMLRTYLCPVDENESNITLVNVREEYFAAILNGYLNELKDDLTLSERNILIYAGKFMVYMQALRFLTDYIQGDVYYSINYPTHNLIRTINQITLLKSYIEKESVFNKILNDLWPI